MEAVCGVVVKSDGIIWFTAPLYGISTDDEDGNLWASAGDGVH